MNTAKPLWFCLWRMTLWGLGLGLGLGAAYGLLVGIPFFPFTNFGPPLGAMCGSIAGLPMGLLEGLTLGVVTTLLHREGVPADSSWYRRAAGLVCVAACVLAVTAYWGIVFWRDRDSVSLRIALTRDLPEALILVVGPLLLATGASWWAGARVAKRYVDEFGEPVDRGFAQPTGENEAEREFRR